MKTTSLAWLSLALITTTLSARAFAADADSSLIEQNWHQWRGPHANGVATQGTPPIEWSEDKNVKWKVKVPGESTATPIIWGDRLFLISAIPTDRTIEVAPEDEAKAKTPDRTAQRYGIKRPSNYFQFVVMCIDRRTGKTLWQQMAKEEVPHEGHHPDGSFASASPTTDGQRLYVSFGSRGVYCFDLDGKPLWSKDLGRMKIQFTFGEGCSPVVHGDSVILDWDHQEGSYITVLDAKTGETKWKIDRDETTNWATPLVVEYGGRTQVIVSGLKRVRSYDLKTGEVIWACAGLTPSAIPSPVSDGKNVYCMSGFLGTAAYAFPLNSIGDMTEADRKHEAKIAWKRRQPGTPYVPSPLLDGELLYFTASNKGILSCLNAETGEPIIDRERLQGIENVYASPVAAGNAIYLTSREGNTLVIKRGEFEKPSDGDTSGKTKSIVLATNKLDDQFDGSAAIVGDAIYFRGRENLYCIGN
jgi:outer membrane protein assembly factor BamB